MTNLGCYLIAITALTFFTHPCNAETLNQSTITVEHKADNFNFPGGVVQFEISKASADLPTVRYGLKEPVIIEHQNYWRVLIGIDLDTAPGEYISYIKQADVESKPTHEKFTISPRLRVTDSAELKLAHAIKHKTFSNLDFSNTQQPALPLLYPAKSENSKWLNLFGNFNFQTNTSTPEQKNYISLTTTEPLIVSAPQAAIISRIETNENDISTLFLDHGRGLYSVLSGINDLAVEEGNGIMQGAVIGKLAHSATEELPNTLYWQCLLNGVYVDPEILTRIMH